MRSLLPSKQQQSKTLFLDIHRKAFDYYCLYEDKQASLYRLLFHAYHAHQVEALLELLEEDPSRLNLLPYLWSETRYWYRDNRERLATVLLKFRSNLGDYRHEELREALQLLSESAETETSCWAKIKIAESYIDEGNIQAAADVVETLDKLPEEAKVEVLLIEAAVARWNGHYDLAAAKVRKSLQGNLSEHFSDRAYLWQGLVAKDEGLFDLALESFQKVTNSPLQRARALYQEGDMLISMADPAQATKVLEEALSLLKAHAPQAEWARAAARLANAYRRLAKFSEAEYYYKYAREQSPDPFTQARIDTERSKLAAAQGRSHEAIFLAAQAIRFFEQAVANKLRLAESQFRLKRSLYRLAVAYWVKDNGQAYILPLKAHVRSSQARHILLPLHKELMSLDDKSDRYESLKLDVTLALALNLSPGKGQALLEPFLKHHNYSIKYVARLANCENLLRDDDIGSVATQLASLRQPPPDPGLKAWKILIEAELLLSLGQIDDAIQAINDAWSIDKVFRSQMAYQWGRILQDRHFSSLAYEWLDRDDVNNKILDLPEAMMLHFSNG